MNRRPFLLFELLLSLTLLMLCLAPLLKTHLAIHKEEYLTLKKLRQERLCAAAFYHLKQQLYEQRQFSWAELCKAGFSSSIDGIEFEIDEVDHSQRKSQSSRALVLQVHFKESGIKRFLFLEHL